MLGSVSLFYMHALLQSDCAVLTYILHCFALCRGPKGAEGGGLAQSAFFQWSQHISHCQ